MVSLPFTIAVSSTVHPTVAVTDGVTLSPPTLPSVADNTAITTSIATPLAVPSTDATDSTHSTNTVTRKRAAPRRKPVCVKEAKVVATPPTASPPSTAQVDTCGVPLHNYLTDCRCQLTIMEHKLKFLEGLLTPTNPPCNTNDDTPSTSTSTDGFGVPLHRYLEDSRCQLEILKHKLKFVEGLLARESVDSN